MRESTVSDLTRRAALAGVKQGGISFTASPVRPRIFKIFTNGTEIHPAVGAAKLLEKDGYKVCVIS